ncbi:hypothetical protein EJV47_09840 [Hymenobacter gummosus]|uniref:Methionyl-tRNA formyltransferase-like protein n=1 Tax=Hymenobacter gummosus TaxID=1776032 RepID=A0A3S0HAH0_9BACT|nr:hypothetical protein [Hymenobacter gummosus]RTQ50905.1 hypothetical protein EJV47_09840 [Hymenobacter gummosus]
MHIDLFRVALSRIESKYFDLQVAYKQNHIIRERIFCYELYHQLRALSQHLPLTINGEPDKRFHDHINRLDWRNPDFIVHKPGSWHDNTLICEVKGILNSKDTRGIFKDIQTLLIYTNKYKYKAGLFILYNHRMDELTTLLKDKRHKIANTYEYDSVYLMTAESAGDVEGPISLAEVLHT